VLAGLRPCSESIGTRAFAGVSCVGCASNRRSGRLVLTVTRSPVETPADWLRTGAPGAAASPLCDLSAHPALAVDVSLLRRRGVWAAPDGRLPDSRRCCSGALGAHRATKIKARAVRQAGVRALAPYIPSAAATQRSSLRPVRQLCASSWCSSSAVPFCWVKLSKRTGERTCGAFRGGYRRAARRCYLARFLACQDRFVPWPESGPPRERHLSGRESGPVESGSRGHKGDADAAQRGDEQASVASHEGRSLRPDPDDSGSNTARFRAAADWLRTVSAVPLCWRWSDRLAGWLIQVRKILVQRADRDPSAFGDFVGGRGRVAVVGKNASCGIQNPLPGLGGSLLFGLLALPKSVRWCDRGSPEKCE
jgi:hypothetical protein